MTTNTYTPRIELRTSCHTRHIRARTILFATSDSNAGPSPTRASTAPARDDNIVAAAGDRTGTDDVLDGQIGDWDAAGGSSSIEITTVVVLLDKNTVSAVPWLAHKSWEGGHDGRWWRKTYLEIEDSVISSYSTLVMVPVSPSIALMRMPAVCQIRERDLEGSIKTYHLQTW